MPNIENVNFVAGGPVQGYIRRDGDQWVGTCQLQAGTIFTVSLNAPFDAELYIYDPQGVRIGYLGNSTPFIWQTGVYTVMVRGYGNSVSDSPFTLSTTVAPKIFPKPATRMGKPITVVIVGDDSGLMHQYEYIIREAEMGATLVYHPDGAGVPYNAAVVAQDAPISKSGINIPFLAFGSAAARAMGLGDTIDVVGRSVELPNPGMKILNNYFRKNDAPPNPPHWRLYEVPRPMQVIDAALPVGNVVARTSDGVVVYQDGKKVWAGMTTAPAYMTSEGRLLIANALWLLVS